MVDTTLDKLIEAVRELANIAFCNAESCDGFTEEEGARIEKYEWFRIATATATDAFSTASKNK